MKPIVTTPAERQHKDKLTYFERYMKEAQHSASIDRFALQFNADGRAWAVTCGGRAMPDTLEDLRALMIESRVGEKNELWWTATEQVGAYTVSREHAEQIVDTQLGVWPPRRILCCATESGLRNLEAKYGPLPAHYYDAEQLPIAA